VPAHNRLDCCGCGYCILGCAYNRKQSALVTWLPRALAAGARVVADATAVSLEVRRPWKRVVARLADRAGRPGRRRLVAEAPVIVVAAGAVDTAVLLLRSGLRGSSGGVGRTLRLHPSAPVGALFDNVLDAHRGIPQSVIVEEFARFFETGRDGFLVLPVAAPPGLAATLLPGIGGPHLRLMREYRHIASAAVLLHDETCGRVRPRLLDGGRPRIDYWPDAADAEALKEGVRRIAEIYLAAGAREVILPFLGSPPVRMRDALDRSVKAGRVEPFRVTLSSVHPQGTCPLGTDPRRSVVTPLLELHDCRGVFVCDTSVFPTSIGVPPQVTTMALAIRAARYIASRYGSLAGARGG
jgi:choline dehydrogenase-like flavoprotein